MQRHTQGSKCYDISDSRVPDVIFHIKSLMGWKVKKKMIEIDEMSWYINDYDKIRN